MPTLTLTGAKSGSTRTARSKPAATRTPARKPAAKQAAARKPAAKAAPASTNGGTRSPKLPEGWTKSDLTRAMKDMQRARAAKDAAAERLAEAQEAVNSMALELIAEGLQMSVVVDEDEGLAISRQWLYKIMEDAGVKTDRQKAGRRTSKPAAKKAAAKSTPAKRSARKTAAKPSARKAPARKPPAAKGRARVRITR